MGRQQAEIVQISSTIFPGNLLGKSGALACMYVFPTTLRSVQNLSAGNCFQFSLQTAADFFPYKHKIYFRRNAQYVSLFFS